MSRTSGRAGTGCALDVPRRVDRRMGIWHDRQQRRSTRVGLTAGSDSGLPTMQGGRVPCRVRGAVPRWWVSAHRTPQRCRSTTPRCGRPGISRSSRERRWCRASAGNGRLATPLPVIGVPVPLGVHSDLHGFVVVDQMFCWFRRHGLIGRRAGCRGLLAGAFVAASDPSAAQNGWQAGRQAAGSAEAAGCRQQVTQRALRRRWRSGGTRHWMHRTRPSAGPDQQDRRISVRVAFHLPGSSDRGGVGRSGVGHRCRAGRAQASTWTTGCR